MPAYDPKRKRILLSAIAAVVMPLVAGCLGGCDNAAGKGDRAVEKDIQDARALLLDTKPDARDAAEKRAEEKFKAATGDAGGAEASASTQNRALAKACFAQFRLEQALDELHTIELKESSVAALIFEVDELAGQLGESGSRLAGYAKFNPEQTKTKIQEKIADAQGGPDKPAWFAKDETKLPTLAAVTQTIAGLEKDIAEKQEQVKSLNDQKLALVNESEQAFKSSDASKGQQSVDEYKRGSDLRKKAADIASNVDQINMALVHTQGQLALANGQKEAVTNAITQFQAQITTVDDGWTAAQEQIKAQMKISAGLVSTGGGIGADSGNAEKAIAGSMADKAKAIKALLEEIETARAAAESHLNDASKYYDDAGKFAGTLRADLERQISDAGGKFRQAHEDYHRIEASVHQQNFALRQAVVERLRGELHASNVASITRRMGAAKDVDAALKMNSNLTAPADLSAADLDAVRKQEVETAAAAYTKADGLLENVGGGDAPDEAKHAALIELVVNHYGMVQLYRSAGDAASAKKSLLDAQTALTATIESQQNQPPDLPDLPVEDFPVLATKKVAPKATTVPNDSTNPDAAPGGETGGPGGGETAAADSPDAAEVRKAALAFFDALARGDQDAAKQLVFAEPGAEELVTTLSAIAASGKKLDDAATAKFGADAVAKIGSQSPSARYRASPITITGDTATIAANDADRTEGQNDFVKQDGVWKLHFYAPVSDKEKKTLSVLKAISAASEKLAADTEAGKFATIDDLKKAVGADMMSAIMGGGTPTPSAP